MITLPVDFNVALFISENVPLCVVIVTVAVIFFVLRIVQRIFHHSGNAL